MLSKGKLLKNRYLIMEKLGGGVSGSTYLAEDKSIENKLCAIKELDPKEKNPENYKIICERFQLEAEILQELSGYNNQIPKWYEDFPLDDKLYIVQEYIEGKTLKELIKETKGGLNQSKVKEILVELLPVLAHIHEQYIHRDIKPENIILRKGSNKPVLIDFGGVKIDYLTTVSNIENAASNTILVFSDGYTAPEQERGYPITASDIFSLGRVAVYLLSAIPPKEIPKDQTDFSTLLWRESVQEILPEFADVIDKSIEHYPGQRYKTAEAMLNDLNAVIFPENNETILEQLGDELTLISNRKPKPFPEKFQKCVSCSFYVTLEDEFCPNCSRYNHLFLNQDELLLLERLPEEYFKLKLLPEMNEDSRLLLEKPADVYWNIAQDKLHNDGKFSVFYHKLSLQLLTLIPIGLVAVYVAFEIVRYYEYGLFPILFAGWILVLLIAGLWEGFDSLLDSYRKRQIRRISSRKLDETADKNKKIYEIETRRKNLVKRLAESSEANEKSRPPLLAKEKLINSRIEELSGWTGKFHEKIKKITSIVSPDASMQTLQKELSDKYTTYNQLIKQYNGKKLEIDLLRCNNSLQKVVKADEMSDGLRNKVEEKLERIIELCNRIIGELKEANVILTGEGNIKLARILYVNDITFDLRQTLIKQEVKLTLLEETSDESILTPEFAEGIELLNACVTIEDFYKELKMLEAEFTKARGITIQRY